MTRFAAPGALVVLVLGFGVLRGFAVVTGVDVASAGVGNEVTAGVSDAGADELVTELATGAVAVDCSVAAAALA